MPGSTVEETKADLFKRLAEEWLSEICCYGEVARFVQDVEGSNDPEGEERRVIHFFTESHRYHISAVVRSGDSGYLGCTVSTRKSRAGEDHTRGNDLPDGPFTKETWDEIVRAIVAYELVPLEVGSQSPADVESGPTEKSSHDFSFGRSDGYGVCKCGARENTEAACASCQPSAEPEPIVIEGGEDA